jgi:NADH-dependent peroxiredoxin subunit F
MVYDLIIIGGSAAATAAGVYAARRGLNFKILTKEFGGEVATSGEIENWPGVIHTDGVSLAQQFKSHLESYKVDLEEGVEVSAIMKQEDGTFCITTHQDRAGMAMDKMPGAQEPAPKCDYVAKAVVVTTGVHPRELTVPGEKEYRNKGVSYCTVCDGPLFRGKTVATVGGGNSALESALMLADIASKVYVINKNAQFKGEDVLIENLKKKSNVEIIYSAKTAAISGEQFVKSLKYQDASGEKELAVDGIFVHIGMVPNSQLIGPGVEIDQFGQIKVSGNGETNIPGLYAAGDVTDVPHKQIVIAAGQGAVATLSAVQYLNRLK